MTVFKQLLNDYKQCLLRGDHSDGAAAYLALVDEYEQAARRAPAVSVPQGWKIVIVNEAFDDLIYWMNRCEEKGHLENCSDLIEPWARFDYRAAPQPPDDLKRGNPATKPDDGPSSCARCGNPWGEAAPVPQGLREAAQAVVERWDTPLWKDVPATAVYIADLRAALAAAPQPPEADMGNPISAAAPVQMPEPFAYVEHHKAGDNLWFDHPGGKHSALYTEQQVRELLAAHGIQEQRT